MNERSEEYAAKAVEILGMNGRLISQSKGSYLNANPKNIVVFNANICIVDSAPISDLRALIGWISPKHTTEKIWFGDIDVTRDVLKLQKLADELGTCVYVLREHDARFANEDSPRLEKAVVKVHPNLPK